MTSTVLHLIRSVTDSLISLMSDDPVRPTIPQTVRVGNNRDIFVLRNPDNSALAITCVSYQNRIPTTESELFELTDTPDVAVFYTIWSYQPGAGRALIFDAVRHIREHKHSIQRFVTLSPPTEMARRFHLKNGAQVLRTNSETVNYEYVMSDMTSGK
jgi:hypothetical protein